MADTPIPVVRLVAATVVQLGSAIGVNVNGSNPPVWWPAGYIPLVGDAVKVLLVDGIAVVHSPVVTVQRPLTGTVSGTAAGGTVPVTTTEAGVLLCRYVGASPANGTLVRLDWQSTTPWVWPSAAVAVTPPPTSGGGGPTPPPTTGSGTHSVAAIDSGSWSAQGWSSFHGPDLTQGAWSGGTSYTGAWFYGAAPQQIAGATVTAARLRLGARRRLGSYNSPLTINLFRTTNASRPAGDTTRVDGPFGIALAANAPAQWVAIPTAWGQALATSGGGLAIAGGTYGGVQGIGGDPASGQIQLDWSR